MPRRSGRGSVRLHKLDPSSPRRSRIALRRPGSMMSSPKAGRRHRARQVVSLPAAARADQDVLLRPYVVAAGAGVVLAAPARRRQASSGRQPLQSSATGGARGGAAASGGEHAAAEWRRMKYLSRRRCRYYHYFARGRVSHWLPTGAEQRSAWLAHYRAITAQPAAGDCAAHEPAAALALF